MSKSSLAPGEIKILRALGKYLLPKDERKSLPPTQLLQLKSYNELRRETGLSDPVLSGYLKNLQKMQFIRRDIDTRKYCLIKENGEFTLKTLYVIQVLNLLLTNKKVRPLSNYNSLIDPFHNRVKTLEQNLTRKRILDEMLRD